MSSINSCTNKRKFTLLKKVDKNYTGGKPIPGTLEEELAQSESAFLKFDPRIISQKNWKTKEKSLHFLKTKANTANNLSMNLIEQSPQNFGGEGTGKSKNRLKFENSVVISNSLNNFKFTKQRIPISNSDVNELIWKIKSREKENVK